MNMLEYLYWQAVGKDHATAKSYLLEEFERKYKKDVPQTT
jgi:hypothetical protein